MMATEAGKMIISTISTNGPLLFGEHNYLDLFFIKMPDLKAL